MALFSSLMAHLTISCIAASWAAANVFEAALASRSWEMIICRSPWPLPKDLSFTLLRLRAELALSIVDRVRCGSQDQEIISRFWKVGIMTHSKASSFVVWEFRVRRESVHSGVSLSLIFTRPQESRATQVGSALGTWRRGSPHAVGAPAFVRCRYANASLDFGCRSTYRYGYIWNA